MPGDVIAFAKLDYKKLPAFLSSDLWRRIKNTQGFGFIQRDEGFQHVWQELTRVGEEAGKRPLDVIEDLAGGGVLVGLRLSLPPEVLLISRSPSAKALRSGLDVVKDFVRAQEGSFPETDKSEHEGVTIERIGKDIAFAVLEETLFVSNSPRAISDMVDLARQKSTTSLARSSAFSPVFSKNPPSGEELVTAAVVPHHVPKFLDGLPKKLDNFVGSMLLSGWLAVLRNSELIHARLQLSEKGLDLDVAAEAATVDGLEAFFPSEAASLDTEEVQRLMERGLLGVIHLRRNFSKWWGRSEDFLDAKGLRELGEFTKVMDLVCGGRSFEDEVLPSFGDAITVVSRRLSYTDLSAEPEPQIPGFAAILRVKKVTEFKRSIVAAFQSAVGLVNIDRAQKGKGLLFVTETESVEGVDVHTATTAPPPKSASVGIEYNFSPSLAVVETRVVLSSSKELAATVVRELRRVDVETASKSKVGVKKKALTRNPPVGFVRVNATDLGQLVGVNKEFLVSKTMLDEGLERHEAETRVAVIKELIGLFSSFEIETRQQGNTSTVSLRLRAADSSTPSTRRL